MAGRYKATGCTRFFVFLIIIVPIAYFGSKYLMDKGIIDNLREKVETMQNEHSDLNEGSEKSESTSTDTEEQEIPANVEALRTRLSELIRTVTDLRTELEEKNKIIEEKNGLIEKLTNQLKDGSYAPIETNKTEPESNNSLEELLKEADKALKKNG